MTGYALGPQPSIRAGTATTWYVGTCGWHRTDALTAAVSSGWISVDRSLGKERIAKPGGESATPRVWRPK